MIDDKTRWRPWIGSVWKQRGVEDLYRIRFTVIGHEGDLVIFERNTDREVFHRRADDWLEGMERI